MSYLSISWAGAVPSLLQWQLYFPPGLAGVADGWIFPETSPCYSTYHPTHSLNVKGPITVQEGTSQSAVDRKPAKIFSLLTFPGLL